MNERRDGGKDGGKEGSTGRRKAAREVIGKGEREETTERREGGEGRE